MAISHGRKEACYNLGQMFEFGLGCKKDMKIATIPVGYADGFYRSNTGSYVFLNNKKCQIKKVKQ